VRALPRYAIEDAGLLGQGLKQLAFVTEATGVDPAVAASNDGAFRVLVATELALVFGIAAAKVSACCRCGCAHALLWVGTSVRGGGMPYAHKELGSPITRSQPSQIGARALRGTEHGLIRPLL
jgi:hypothetical protein